MNDQVSLARALAAERRLACLVRLASAIIPPGGDMALASYRPPSAWRAFVREVYRSQRYLWNSNDNPEDRGTSSSH